MRACTRRSAGIIAKRPHRPVSPGWPKPWQLRGNAARAVRSVRLAKDVEAGFGFAIDDPGPHRPGRAAAALKLEIHAISRRQREARVAGAKTLRRQVHQAPDEWGGGDAGLAQADVSLSWLTGLGTPVNR